MGKTSGELAEKHCCGPGQVTAEEGQQEAVVTAVQPKDGAASDGKIPRNEDASTDDKMSFTQGHDSKGAALTFGHLQHLILLMSLSNSVDLPVW